MSVAACVAVELLRLASGGEIITVAPGRKFAPIKVICTRSVPCVARLGPILVKDGGGAGTPAGVTVKIAGLEVSPVAGSRTVIWSAAGTATSEARMIALSCKALTKVVARLLPLTCTS